MLDPRFVLRPDILLRAVARKWLSNGGPVVAKTAWGDWIEVDAHKFIGSQIYLRGTFELHVCETLARLTDPGEEVCDVGANLGLMTSLLSKRVGSEGKVFACEAHPEVFACLQANIGRWPRKNVQAFHAAVSRSVGELRITDGGTSVGNEGIARVVEDTDTPSARRSFSVPSLTLDNLFAGRRIGMMKVDVEGHELAVFEGAAASLKAHVIRDIVYEGPSFPHAAVHRLLAGYDYQLFRIEAGFWKPRLIPLDESTRLPEPLGDFLATTQPDRAMHRMAPGGWHVLWGGI